MKLPGIEVTAHRDTHWSSKHHDRSTCVREWRRILSDIVSGVPVLFRRRISVEIGRYRQGRKQMAGKRSYPKRRSKVTTTKFAWRPGSLAHAHHVLAMAPAI